VLYRFAGVAIVVFWLVMTGLLVRMEWFPGTSELLPVPVDHLFKLMFLHEQTSDLVLCQDQDRIGDLTLQPHRFPPNAGVARNLLTITGSMVLNLPGWDTRHLTLRGAFELDDHDNAQRFELTATVHEPVRSASMSQGEPSQRSQPSMVIVFGGEPIDSRYHYQVRDGDRIVAEQSGTPETLLDQPDLRSVGISPAVLSALVHQQAASTEVTARRGVLQNKGEDIDTYDVTLRQGDTVVATIQMNQLGEVLSVNTSFGYSLLAKSLEP
jgi:hypothetical protein